MPTETEQLGKKLTEIKMEPKSMLAKMGPALFVAVAALFYGGYIWLIRGKENEAAGWLLLGAAALLVSLTQLRHLSDKIELYEKGFLFQAPGKFKGKPFLLEKMEDFSSSRTHSSSSFTHWADTNRMSFRYEGTQVTLVSQCMPDMHFQFQKAYGRSSYSAPAGPEGETDLRKDKTGEAFRAILRRVVADLLPEENGLSLLYGFHSSSTSGGRTTHTSFYHYAVAWREDICYLIPINFSGGEIFPGQPLRYPLDRLGRIAPGFYGKTSCEPTLYDAEGKRLVTFRVCPSFIKDDFRPIEIKQEEEAARFYAILERWTAQLAEAHPELAEKPKGKYGLWSGKNSLWFGLAGLLSAPFTAGIGGLVGGVLGIVLYCVGVKKFGKDCGGGVMGTLGLVFCLVAAMFGVVSLFTILPGLFSLGGNSVRMVNPVE